MTNPEMLTTGLALLGGYIAFRQWRNAKNKIRIDLYPKRVEVFRCTEEFLNRAWTGNFSDQTVLPASFFHCKREARFLFDKKLADYLEGLYEGVENLFHYENRLQIEGDSMDFETKSMVQHQCYGSRAWLGEQNMHIREKFAKYLDLSKIR